MNKHKFTILLVLLVIPAMLIGCANTEELDVGDIEILVFGIGRSDAIIIATENYTMMIDTGERQHGPHIAQYLLSQNISTIDYLIITHFDRDHVGGAYVIIDYLDVRSVVVPNYSRDSNHVNRFELALENAQIEPLILTEAIRFTLDSVDFILDPSDFEYVHFPRAGYDEDYEENPVDVIEPMLTGNDFSIIVSVTHGNNSFLFTGDAVALRLQQLLENDEIMSIDYDFLKVPRHGRHNRQSVGFINAISPRYAVITGFHPSLISTYYPERPSDERVVSALEEVGAEIFFTMTHSVRGRSDGTNLTFQYDDFFVMP